MRIDFPYILSDFSYKESEFIYPSMEYYYLGFGKSLELHIEYSHSRNTWKFLSNSENHCLFHPAIIDTYIHMRIEYCIHGEVYDYKDWINKLEDILGIKGYSIPNYFSKFISYVNEKYFNLDFNDKYSGRIPSK